MSTAAAAVSSFYLVSHHRVDHDELVAGRIIARHGEKQFPGTRKNPILTVDAGMFLKKGETGNDWVPNGYIPVGVGGGDFDEHGKGDGKSAATMAAEHFGATEDPGLKPILAYALKADDTATDGPFAVARLIKDFHAAGVSLESIRAMHDRWFDSQYLWGSGITIARPDWMPTGTLQSIAIDFLLDLFGFERTDDVPITSFAEAMELVNVTAEQADWWREVQRYVDQGDNTPMSPFDLRGLVAVMQMTGVPESEVIRDVCAALVVKVKVQKDFMAAQQEYRLAKNLYVAECAPLVVAVIHSDNEQMNRAARSVDKDLAVLVQRRSTGHTNVFSDQLRDLRPILARLRDLEHQKSRQRGQLSDAQLLSGGTLPRRREWFGFEKRGRIIAIFNGSLKTKLVPRTKLTLKEIVRCVREGLRA